MQRRKNARRPVIGIIAAAVVIVAAVVIAVLLNNTEATDNTNPSGADLRQSPGVASPAADDGGNAYLGDMVLEHDLLLDGEKIDREELAYFYGMAVNEYINTAYASFGDSYQDIIRFSLEDGINSLAAQSCPLTGYEDRSWEDYFLDRAAENIMQTTVLYREALKKNVELDGQDREEIEASIDSVKDYCEQNDIRLEHYLGSTYGKGATLESLQKYIEKTSVVAKYTMQVAESFEYSEAELEEYYRSHREEIDSVTLRYYAFEKTDDNRLMAEEFLQSVTDEESFRQAALRYCAESDREYFETDAATARVDMYGTDMPEYIKAWAYDQARTPGETAVLDGDGSYDVILFLGRSVPDYNRVTLRLIQCKAAESASQASVALFEKAEQRTEELLELYNEGEKTEESFAALAKQHSEDESTKHGGGLYKSVSKTDVAQNIRDWAFADEREAGEVTVLPATNGYCILYFVGREGKDYLETSKARLSSEAYSRTIDGLLDGHSFELIKAE